MPQKGKEIFQALHVLITVIIVVNDLNLCTVMLFKNSQGKLMDVYPKFYDHGGDDDCAIFENLVLDKGFAVLDKTQKQDFEAAR